MKRQITVEELLREREDSLGLENLTPEAGLQRPIGHPNPTSPGLALAGFMERVRDGRAQVFGETEMAYLDHLEPQVAMERLREFFHHEIPVVFVTKGIQVPEYFLSTASEYEIPVFRTTLGTGVFFHRLNPYLEAGLAPTVSLHGSLADVYGVGLLFVGESGIGKSECVLDLVERGHRLVADDVVNITKKGPDVIVGHASDILGHHMEVRGIGILDVEKLFGIRGVRLQKRIEVVVKLVRWEEGTDYERLGIDEKMTQILGVEVPVVTIPVSPGKNITVISEVIAMNHMLKIYGENTAEQFSQRLAEEIKRRRATGGYLESDTE